MLSSYLVMLEYCSFVHLSLQVVAVRPVELMSLPTEFLLLLFLNPKVCRLLNEICFSASHSINEICAFVSPK